MDFLFRLFLESMSDFEKDSPLTLRQIALKIKAAIDKSFPSMFWLQTEMVKLNFYPSSGHAFPDLVEKNGNQIYAQIRSTIWKSDLQAIRSKFLSVVGRDVEDGIKILCKVEVKYHEVYGLSLRIVDIDPNYTLGEMAVQRAKAIEALKQEGVFDKNRKLVLPDVPIRLAVISLSKSKG